MTRLRTTSRTPYGGSAHSTVARTLLVAFAAIACGGWGAAWVDSPNSGASGCQSDPPRIDASGPVGTEAPGWADVLRSISAAKGGAASMSPPALKAGSD